MGLSACRWCGAGVEEGAAERFDRLGAGAVSGHGEAELDRGRWVLQVDLDDARRRRDEFLRDEGEA